MSFESVRISFKVLFSRRWGAEATDQDVEKYTVLLSMLRPFVENNDVNTLNLDEMYQLFQAFDNAFNPEERYHWNIVSFCISFLEVVVVGVESLSALPAQKIGGYTSILLEHSEVRIRTAVAELVKALCLKVNPETDALYSSLISVILNGVHGNWQRASTTREAVLGTEKQILMDDTTGWHYLESYVRALHALFVGISRHSVSSAMRHLQQHFITVTAHEHSTMFQSCYTSTEKMIAHLLPIAVADSISNMVRVDCAELLFTHASQHLNRHIRELTFRFIADLLALASSTTVNVGAYDMPSRGVQMTDVFPRMPGTASPYVPLSPPVPPVPVTPAPSLPSATEPSTLTTIIEPAWHTNVDYYITSHRIASALITGLQDDWSQIRHAASMACQTFLLSLTTNTTNDTTIHSPLLSLYWPALLPRLCMNRFYPAVSVQTVSQATWRDILGPNALGRQLLAQHANSVVSYYVSMTSARNHMTAEAACQAISEFVQRIDSMVVNVHIPVLLEALLDCLRDDRWPVRDAAIVASSMVTRYYATNSVTIAALPILLQLWQENLTDFIWSIREHAAMAFAEAVQCTNSAHSFNAVKAAGDSGDIIESSLVVTSQQSLVLQTALQYIRTHLLYALQSPEVVAAIALKGVVIADPTTTVTSTSVGVPGLKPTKEKAAFSFLPQSLLEADAAAKAKKFQKETIVDTITITNTPVDPGCTITTTATTSNNTATITTTTTTTTDSTTSNITSTTIPHSKNKDRKGWGCCIDCVELRTCLPWEVTHGAVYLLREMSMVDPSVLFERYDTSTGYSNSSNASNSNSSSNTNSNNDGNDGNEEGTVKDGVVSDSQNTLLSKLFSLLSDSVASSTANDATGTTASTSERELLFVAVYEEVPIFLSIALQYVRQCLPAGAERVRFFYTLLPLEVLFSSFTRDLKAAVSQDGSSAADSAPKYTTTTYGADGSVSTSMRSGYKTTIGGSGNNLTAGIVDASVGSNVGNSLQSNSIGARVSNSSAVNRRNQQVARRSARNRDKVVIAAERCLTRVLDLLCSAEVRDVVSIVYHAGTDSKSPGDGNSGAGERQREEQLHTCLLGHFAGEMRLYVKNLMKW